MSEVSIGSPFEASHARIRTDVGSRKVKHWQVRRFGVGPQTPANLEAAEIGKIDVQDHEPEWPRGGQPECLYPGAGFLHVVAGLPQDTGYRVAAGCVIVDIEDTG